MSDGFAVKSKIRNYEVEFVDNIIDVLMAERRKNPFFLIDQNIAKLYSKKICSQLPDNRIFTINAKEKNKSIEYCQEIIKMLIKASIRKNNYIIAIGGGITQDISAFISSVLFRGIDWIFIPTTLLAQADSCIGGKTSINFGLYKNLLGNFYPPKKICIDLNFLQTLPKEEIKSGIGEMLHFYLIAGSKLANELSVSYKTLLESPLTLKDYIRNSLLIKKKVIEADEFDNNKRNIFNYGHTFGHAIETVSKYKINHGQAVTLGMDIANYISFKLGLIDKKTLARMHRLISKNLPIFRLNKKNINDYLGALAKDKKNVGDDLKCVLTFGPRKMEIRQLPLDDMLKGIVLSYFEQSN